MTPFERLARTVSGEYRRKGYPAKRAEYIGRATAAKVYRERLRRRAPKPGTRAARNRTGT